MKRLYVIIMRIYAKDFFDKEHDWNQVLIDEDQTWTRGEIKDYYVETADKIFPYVSKREVLVYIGVSKNQNVLKRNIKEGVPIVIMTEKGVDDDSSFEYWVYRRVIEFHRVIGERTDLVWVDIDLHPDSDATLKKSLYNQAVKNIDRIAAVIKQLYPTANIKKWKSGKTGLHVEGYLPKSVDTNGARKDLKAALDEAFADDELFSTGLVKKGKIRLDVSTLKNKGSIRVPYSLSVSGNVKEPL